MFLQILGGLEAFGQGLVHGLSITRRPAKPMVAPGSAMNIAQQAKLAETPPVVGSVSRTR